MIGHCAAGYMHDWRHLGTRKTYKYESSQVGLNNPTEVKIDTWYCTRCRKTEETERA
jgi:hypothetical protein